MPQRSLRDQLSDLFQTIAAPPEESEAPLSDLPFPVTNSETFDRMLFDHVSALAHAMGDMFTDGARSPEPMAALQAYEKWLGCRIIDHTYQTNPELYVIPLCHFTSTNHPPLDRVVCALPDKPEHWKPDNTPIWPRLYQSCMTLALEWSNYGHHERAAHNAQRATRYALLGDASLRNPTPLLTLRQS